MQASIGIHIILEFEFMTPRNYSTCLKFFTRELVEL
jgi:hypothetical protein